LRFQHRRLANVLGIHDVTQSPHAHKRLARRSVEYHRGKAMDWDQISENLLSLTLLQL
jgi:hypothetical protein